MNDSFLEDLELVPAEQKTGTAISHAEKFITMRQHSQSVVSDLCQGRDEFEALINQQRNCQQHKLSSTSTVLLKTSTGKKLLDNNSPSKDMYSKRQQVNPKDRIQIEPRRLSREHKNPTKLRVSEKKGKIDDEKLKLVENVDPAENSKSSLSSSDGKKRISSRESSRLSDGSAKENSRPSDSSKESTREWRRFSSENSKKKGETSDERIESVAMLNAIKEIVSSYTKMESSKIMKMMQDHYINSQANLMKQLLMISDDLHHSHSEDDTSRIQILIKENTRLLDNVAFLKNRVEELQKVLEVTDKLRQENTALKLKILELQK